MYGTDVPNTWMRRMAYGILVDWFCFGISIVMVTTKNGHNVVKRLDPVLLTTEIEYTWDGERKYIIKTTAGKILRNVFVYEYAPPMSNGTLASPIASIYGEWKRLEHNLASQTMSRVRSANPIDYITYTPAVKQSDEVHSELVQLREREKTVALGVQIDHSTGTRTGEPKPKTIHSDMLDSLVRFQNGAKLNTVLNRGDRYLTNLSVALSRSQNPSTMITLGNHARVFSAGRPVMFDLSNDIDRFKASIGIIFGASPSVWANESKSKVKFSRRPSVMSVRFASRIRDRLTPVLKHVYFAVAWEKTLKRLLFKTRGECCRFDPSRVRSLLDVEVTLPVLPDLSTVGEFFSLGVLKPRAFSKWSSRITNIPMGDFRDADPLITESTVKQDTRNDTDTGVTRERKIPKEPTTKQPKTKSNETKQGPKKKPNGKDKAKQGSKKPKGKDKAKEPKQGPTEKKKPEKGPKEKPEEKKTSKGKDKAKEKKKPENGTEEKKKPNKKGPEKRKKKK